MIFTHSRTLRILIPLLAVSLAVVSVAGGFFPSTYERDSASLAAQAVGQDLVDLFIAVPMLLVTFYLALRGNRLAAFLLAGTLAYILYSFVIYCFGVYFNRWFLLYCLTLGLALYSFILVFSDLKKLKVENWFNDAPVRLIAGYLVFVALVFYVLWLKSVVPAILRNEVPREVADYNLLVNPVHVIDLSIALPGILIGSVLLWRKSAVGYIIASVSLVFMVLLTLALAAMVGILALRGISEDNSVAMVFGVLSISSVTMVVLLFRKLKSSFAD